MYKLEQLFEDIVKVKGSLRKGVQADKSDYTKVWDAFNRYLTVTFQKRQTLSVHNFCKVGWRIEEFQGKPRLRPHFQLAESFMRVFNVESKAHPCIADKHFTSTEEFNFSKAAIRYTQSLTKDNIFMGLRAIVHQIGEASSREQVVIDFEVGQLIVKNRNVHFIFMADIYAQEGLDVPEGALEKADYVPSNTYGPPSKDALSLNVQGKAHSSVVANSYGGWEDVDLSPRSATTPGSQRSRPSALMIDNPSVVGSSEDQGRHFAQVEALSRHIGKMEADAAKAISEKHLWEGHLERCNGIEENDMEWRRTIEKDHAEQLRLQIRQDEDRRVQDKAKHKTRADMHGFPKFEETNDADVRGYQNQRRENLKQDLDLQVEARNRMQQLQKQRERELEMNNIEASQFEIKSIKRDEQARKNQERAILAQAWDQDVRLKTVKKAIEDHHRTPGPKSVLSGLVGLVSNIGSSAGGSAPGSVAGSITPLGMPSPRLGTPGGLSDRSSLASSRGLGSARRKTPTLGAAASLSLQKEKLKLSARH